MIKRIFDIIVSLICMAIFLPVFFILSILVFLEDFGAVFFVQDRVGYAGQLFRLYKFRTMSAPVNPEIKTIDIGNTSRITRIGRFLRKTKLDELPQLINIIKGDMSIVGPRPEVPQFITYYPDRWLSVLKVKPGLTDYASIEFRNEEEILVRSVSPEKTYIEEILPKKLKYYEQYEKNHTFLGDFKIIIKTILAIIFK